MKTTAKAMRKETEKKESQSRHLYLMRHGKAPKNKKKNDVLRPMSKRGRKDVKKIGKLLREKHVSPDLVLCSPAVRTLETLEKLRKSFDTAEIVFVDDLYMADAADMMNILRRTANDKREVLVIGHNPGLRDVLPLICDADADEADSHNHNLSEGFPTSALACLEIGQDWNRLGFEPVRLMNLIYSSDL